jgi:hypothetical protein
LLIACKSVEFLRARDLIVFLLIHSLPNRLLHLLRDFGKDVGVVEPLEHTIDHFRAHGGVDGEIRLLGLLCDSGAGGKDEHDNRNEGCRHQGFKHY